jgi:hypothetical protein
MAAKRIFRVSAELPGVVSRCSRKVLIRAASNCSSVSAEGATFEFLSGELEQRLKAVGIGVARVLAS